MNVQILVKELSVEVKYVLFYNNQPSTHDTEFGHWGAGPTGCLDGPLTNKINISNFKSRLPRRSRLDLSYGIFSRKFITHETRIDY